MQEPFSKLIQKIFDPENLSPDKIALFYKISQLSHKIKPAAASHGQSWRQVCGLRQSRVRSYTLSRRSFSEDGSFAVALTYHQPCRTIHPPVAFKAVYDTYGI